MEIYRALPTDGYRIARIDNSGWRVGYDRIVDKSAFDHLEDEERGQRWTDVLRQPQDATYLAEIDGITVGFCSIAVDEAGVGEVKALVVDPDQWRTGIGAMLLNHAENELQVSGADSGHVYVMPDDHRARSFYEKHGWQTDGDRLTHQVRGAEVEVVRYQKDFALNRAIGL